MNKKLKNLNGALEAVVAYQFVCARMILALISSRLNALKVSRVGQKPRLN